LFGDSASRCQRVAADFIGDKAWIENDLRDAFAVSQVYKYAASVITTGGHPPKQNNLGINIRCAQLPAAMRAF
jgi:hypothetical protein